MALRSVPIGTIFAFGGSAAPAGWALCNGTAVSRTTFAELFRILGTAFGAGDGSTTFNLPDLRGRFPLGKATAGTGSTLGATGGAIDHTHGPGTLQVESHTHSVATVARTLAGGAQTNSEAAATGGTSPLVTGGVTATGNPPFQAVHFIIRNGA